MQDQQQQCVRLYIWSIGRSISLFMPEFLRVLPLQYLNIGPEMSSSHWRHLFNYPFITQGLFRISETIQTNPQCFFVFNVFQNHTWVQALVNPRDLIHFINFLLEAKCYTPHLRTGLVKSVVKQTYKSVRVEHFPQVP